MARSVNCLNNADLVLYKSGYEIQDNLEWDIFVEEIIENIQYISPSFEVVKNSWDNNETKIILENRLCFVGMSEYRGLVSISFRHKEENDNYDDISGISKNWLEMIKPKLKKLGDLTKIGTFSNGEAMFKNKAKDKTYSSKEGFCEWA